MVKKTQFYTALLLILISAANTSAQRFDSIPRRTLSLNAGASLVHLVVAYTDQLYSKDVEFYAPALQLMYDFTPRYKKKYLTRLELGAMVSFEYLEKRWPNYRFYLKGKQYFEDYIDHFKRYNFSLSARYMYLRNPNFELFSGLRAGVTYWEYFNDSRDTSAGYYWKEENNIKVAGYEMRVARKRNAPVISPQIIFIGGRYFFNKRFAANFELCAGAPHFLSVGGSYRW